MSNNNISYSELKSFVSKQLLKHNAVNLPYLVKIVHKRFSQLSESAVYYRVYRLMRFWSSKGIVELKKIGGLLWIIPKRVDLIYKYSKIETRKTLPLKSHRSAKLPTRASPLKTAAALFLTQKNELDEKDYQYIFDLFTNYLRETELKIIVLYDNFNGNYVLLRYSHRFRKNRILQILYKYRAIWDYFTDHYKKGVFITLTVDPRDYSNIYEIAKDVVDSFRRFKVWLRKRFKRKIDHLAVNEFTDKGRLHIHSILFGIHRIGDKKSVITPELTRIGFGKINYLYKIVNRDGVWMWVKNKPNMSLSLTPDRYLEKYFIKSLDFIMSGDSSGGGGDSVNIESMKVALYWALNKRFFTYSRIPIKFNYSSSVRSMYEYVGVYNIWDIPQYIIQNAINPEIIYDNYF